MARKKATTKKETKKANTKKEVKEVKTVEVKKDKPVKKQVYLTAIDTFTVILDHNEYCSKVGKCMCNRLNGRRVPSSKKFIGGKTYIVDIKMTELSVIKALQKSGKLIIKGDQ